MYEDSQYSIHSHKSLLTFNRVNISNQLYALDEYNYSMIFQLLKVKRQVTLKCIPQNTLVNCHLQTLYHNFIYLMQAQNSYKTPSEVDLASDEWMRHERLNLLPYAHIQTAKLIASLFCRFFSFQHNQLSSYQVMCP